VSLVQPWFVAEPYPYRKEKEAHELIFHGIVASGIDRGCIHMATVTDTPANKLTETCSLSL